MTEGGVPYLRKESWSEGETEGEGEPVGREGKKRISSCAWTEGQGRRRNLPCPKPVGERPKGGASYLRRGSRSEGRSVRPGRRGSLNKFLLNSVGEWGA
jgi:hypothetical protein